MTGSVQSRWPVDRRQWLYLALALVASVGAFAVIGHSLTEVFAPNAITRFDVEAADRLAANRTPQLDSLAHWSSFLADTTVKIVVTSLFAVFAFVVRRRWHEPVFLAVTLVFEATVFIIVTTVVGRSRPDVPRLEDSPVDSSFPSGHVAAAVVYGAFVVIVFWHTRRTWARVVAVAVCVVLVGAVGWARLYEGMHYLSDVVAGTALGLWSVAVCLMVLGRPDPNGATSASGRLEGEDGADPVGEERVDDGEIAGERPVADQAIAGGLHRP